MHRIWRAPELAWFILHHLDRADLISMAQSCRMTWHCVIPLLWKEVFDAAYLVGLVPAVQNIRYFWWNVCPMNALSPPILDLIELCLIRHILWSYLEDAIETGLLCIPAK